MTGFRANVCAHAMLVAALLGNVGQIDTSPDVYCRRALSRRSHRTPVYMERLNRLMDCWIPLARVLHPYPIQSSALAVRGGSAYMSRAHAALCEGTGRLRSLLQQ